MGTIDDHPLPLSQRGLIRSNRVLRNLPTDRAFEGSSARISSLGHRGEAVANPCHPHARKSRSMASAAPAPRGSSNLGHRSHSNPNASPPASLSPRTQQSRARKALPVGATREWFASASRPPHHRPHTSHLTIDQRTHRSERHQLPERLGHTHQGSGELCRMLDVIVAGNTDSISDRERWIQPRSPPGCGRHNLTLSDRQGRLS